MAPITSKSASVSWNLRMLPSPALSTSDRYRPPALVCRNSRYTTLPTVAVRTLFGSAVRRSRDMRRSAVSAASVSSARRTASAYPSIGRLMNTATAPATIAVIAITMTISMSVTPRARLRQGIGCIAHAVAVEHDEDIRSRRSVHAHLDEQRIARRNRTEGLLAHGDSRAVGGEAGDHSAGNVPDPSHGIGVVTVVVAHVVERRRAACNTRFAGLRTERQLAFIVVAADSARAIRGAGRARCVGIVRIAVRKRLKLDLFHECFGDGESLFLHHRIGARACAQAERAHDANHGHADDDDEEDQLDERDAALLSARHIRFLPRPRSAAPDRPPRRSST